jgi:hypothetical protein
MSNTVALNGEGMFMYFVSHFKMTTSEALKSMEDNGQDMAWFYNLPEGGQTAIKVDDPFLTSFIKGEVNAKV